MQKVDIDFFSIIVATFLQWVIAIFWYSPLLFKFSRKSLQSYKTLSFHISFIVIGFIIAFFLAIIEGFMGVMSTSDGMILGIFMAIGFVLTTSILPTFRKELSLKHYFLDMVFWVVAFAVMGGILAV